MRIRQVLVDGRTPVNYEMVAPVVETMRADPRVRFAFTASEDPDRLADIYRNAPAGTRLIGSARAAFHKWDAYLTSDFMWATLPRGTVRIQMFHGVAGKYGFDSPQESMRAWHRLFFVNERRLRNVVNAGAIDADSDAPRLVGMPKVDCLVDGTLQRERILADFDLDPARPTVLYAPTWSPASSLNRMGVSLLERLVSLPINVIVKLHDRSRDLREQYSGGIDWVARLTPLLSRPNTRLALHANITPCLVAADVMITDHSSAGFEYLLLDRPLIRIELSDLIRQANVHQDYVQLLADASTDVQSPEGAVHAVEEALADPADLSAIRRRIAADLFYRPGTASARCASALYDVLELAAPATLTSATREVNPWPQSA
ncbi:MAG TPA: CDP-glycerol glycerophosphotransferase family protein [Vicinamibacterales bacterium]|nr:CDP-glycerol glycerophosphotransferase family protein [Vicinamibacterales bacterium]